MRWIQDWLGMQACGRRACAISCPCSVVLKTWYNLLQTCSRGLQYEPSSSGAAAPCASFCKCRRRPPAQCCGTWSCTSGRAGMGAHQLNGLVKGAQAMAFDLTVNVVSPHAGSIWCSSRSSTASGPKNQHARRQFLFEASIRRTKGEIRSCLFPGVLVQQGTEALFD